MCDLVVDLGVNVRFGDYLVVNDGCSGGGDDGGLEYNL